MGEFDGRTVIITGASRGIGRAIALKLARHGANIVVAAKSSQPHPKLKGTIHSTVEEIEAAGGKALACQVDVRFEEQVDAMVAAVIGRFGGIDGLVNNAGAIGLTNVEHTSLKSFDLMQAVNVRAVFLCAQKVLPFLKQSANAHILSMAPPLALHPRWLAPHAPYTLSKYGISLLSLGMAAEFASYRIAVNCLWPKTIIATAAIEFAVGSRETYKFCRRPEIVADAAYEILRTTDCKLTGRTLTDEEILRERGIGDFSDYAQDPDYADRLIVDLFVED